MANYNRSPSEVILHLLAISGLLMIVNGRLLKTLEDTVVLVNDSIRLSCQSDKSAEIHFYHNSISRRIYAGGTIFKPYKERFKMETTDNHTYTLIKENAGPEDAGVYMCREEEGRGQSSSANLTVLDTRLICESNMIADGYIGPNTYNLQGENMTFSCSVSFNGKPPRLVWRASNDIQLINSPVCDYQPNRVNCRLTLTSDPSYDGTIFTCQTAQPSGTQYNCSTKVIEVQSNHAPIAFWTVLAFLLLSIAFIVAVIVGSLIYIKKLRKRNIRTLEEQKNTSTEQLDLLESKDKVQEKERQKLLAEKEVLEKKIQELQQELNLSEKPSCKNNWKWIHKLQYEDSNKPINGIAILNGELFSIRADDSKFEVYSIKRAFLHTRSCQVEDLTTPKDMISCKGKNCLFIKDYIKGNQDKGASARIFRVSPNGDVKNKWEIDGDTGQISLAGKCNLIVPLWNGSKLLEFTFDGENVREIKISPEEKITCLRQAILVDYSYFVLIHGDDDSKEKHRVCALDLKGKLMKSFGDAAGNSASQVNLPSHLVIDEDNSIIVVDRKNRRLLRLSPQLKFLTEMHLDAPKVDELSSPWRVCLDEERRFLILADNLFSKCKPNKGVEAARIFVYSATDESPLNKKP